MIRGSVTELGRDNGKESVDVVVRAASKPGAIMAARLSAGTIIPVREQSVSNVINVSNLRLFDQWRITIRDKKSLQNV